MQDPSHICDLHHSSLQGWILNPLSKAGNRTCILTNTVRFLTCWATTGTPKPITCMFNSWRVPSPHFCWILISHNPCLSFPCFALLVLGAYSLAVLWKGCLEVISFSRLKKPLRCRIWNDSLPNRWLMSNVNMTTEATVTLGLLQKAYFYLWI